MTTTDIHIYKKVHVDWCVRNHQKEKEDKNYIEIIIGACDKVKL